MTIDSIGNVGIGTNSTTRRLDVVAAASSDCNIEFQTDKTDGLVQLLMSNDARQWNVRVNSDDTFAIRDNTAATERMRIDASGNVGIGTSLPTAGLHIDNPGNGAITAILDTDNTAVKIVFRNNTETGNNVQIGADGSSLVALTAATERMRIDASGNLLVGKTSSNVATAGHELLDYGRAIHTVNASTVQIINRLSNDGDITIFQKDGSTVGSIGTLSGFTYLGSGDTGMLFVSSDETIRPHNTTTNVARDNAISLGEATVRFKDAHFSGTVNAANFNTTSDATLKTNVETLSGSLDAVKSLRGVSFDWLDNGGSEIGVIAQEVEAVLPDVVSTNDEGIKSVKYGNMVAVLIEAIKEQQAQIDELKAQLNS
jgi:hypothetical protein